MHSSSAKRKALAAETEAGYTRSWRQIVANAAASKDPTLFRLAATAACSRALIRSMRRSRIKRLFLVEGSYQLTAYNISAMAVRKFSFDPKGRAYQQWCTQEGIKQSVMTDVLTRLAKTYADYGIAQPEPVEFQPVKGDSPEAWQFIDLLLGSNCLRLLHNGYHDSVGPITASGKVPGIGSIAIGEIALVSLRATDVRYRFEGTTIPLKLLQYHAAREVVDLHGLNDAGEVCATADLVYDNRTIIERDVRFTVDQLKHQAFSSTVQLHYGVVESGLWKSLPEVLPSDVRLVAEFNGRHMRGTPADMRQHIRRYLQEGILYRWQYPPNTVELPRLTAEHPVIRKVAAATIGSDPLTGGPLRAFGTVARVQHSSKSGPYFGVRWVLDREVAQQLRRDAIKALMPTIARLKRLRRLDHADAVQQAAAVAEAAERLARVSPPVAPPDTLRRLRQLPHPAIRFTAQKTRDWAKATQNEIEGILKEARSKR